MYPESTLNEIRNRIDIVDLIGDYVALKKSGQGYVGLCPFHNEKTASFHVHPLKQCFHCFGCQKGGNIFTFVCAIEGLPFPEAVRKLGARAGIELRQVEPTRAENTDTQKTPVRLLAALEWATRYFHYLLTEMKDYAFALEYLASRNISKSTMKKFKLGVSPKGWNTLLDLMLKRKFPFEELVQAGLIIQREGGKNRGYDRFRSRLMFPISNSHGEIIGFGARLLTEEKDQPKYINSPESALFSKRQQLYGLFENQRGIRVRGEAVIVEGYMDVVGLMEAGVDNAVATMGTALTEEHCKKLKGITSRVVTVFDPDAGGQEAWHRSVHLFMSEGLFAKDLSLPDQKDPDEFVIESGAEVFYKMCEKAPRQVTKLLKEIASQGSLSGEESAKLLAQLSPVLVASKKLPLSDRALLWDDISLLLNVSISALKEISAGNPFRGQKNQQTASASAPVRKPSLPPVETLDIKFFRACCRNPKAFLNRPKQPWQDTLKDERVKEWLDRLHESQDEAKFRAILELLLQKETDSLLLSVASEAPFASKQEETQEETQELFSELYQSLCKRAKEAKIKRLTAQIRLNQRLGDDKEGLRLLERLKELRSE